MEVGGRRGRAKTGVVAGSVWESRMKSDEVKGGIKVYNAEEKPEENADKKTRPKQSPIGVNGKRKTWKSESSDGFERNPIQTPRQKSEPTKDLDQRCKELSVSADGIKVKSPVQPKKTRSEAVGKELSLSVDGIDRNTNRIRKVKSESSRLIGQSDGESDGIERNLIPPKKVQIRMAKSASLKLIGQSDGESDGIERNPIQLRKVKSESNKGLGESGEVSERNPIPLTKAEFTSIDGLGGGIERNSIELEEAKSELRKGGDEAIEEIEKNPDGIQKAGSDGICKEVGVCEEKVISSGFQVKSAPEMVEDENEEEDDGGGDEEDWDEELEEEMDEEIEIDEEKKGVEVVKEIDIKTEEKPKEIVNEEKKMHKVKETPKPISPIVKKQVPPPVNHSRTHPIPTKTKSVPVSSGFQKAPETHKSHKKLQSLVDLVMWRDVSKSAFVFGLGTFIIISFSYTKDLNISFITVVSYLGLVYLGAIFLFRSIICRGVLDVDDSSQDYVVGEEDATWLLKMVLPYLNEFLLKFRALFSGDPATTMKLAVLLFVLARCGSSITIWKMGKLGFFGVFTVPKICSSYSTQLTAFGKFWVRRFKDAWETCSHKKAVAFGLFTLVWNLSSVVARIWAVFMLYVAFRYYQQSMMRDDWVQEEPRCETTWQDQIGGSRRGRSRAAAVDSKKEKKRF